MGQTQKNFSDKVEDAESPVQKDMLGGPLRLRTLDVSLRQKNSRGTVRMHNEAHFNKSTSMVGGKEGKRRW